MKVLPGLGPSLFLFPMWSREVLLVCIVFYVNVRPAKWGVTAKLCYNNYDLNHLIIAGLHSPQYFYLLLLVLIKFQIHPVTIKIPPGCLE